MTEQEWKQRSAERILKAVRNAGTIKIRDLQRATHYNRGPRDSAESILLWGEALDYLEKKKLIVILLKRLCTIPGEPELGCFYHSAMTPDAAQALSPPVGFEFKQAR
jgi:hypothetical protein